MSSSTAQLALRWLDEAARQRLRARLEHGLELARSRREAVLVSVTAECVDALDPVAVAAASRRPGEPWFCLEQPDRRGAAMAALGQVQEVSGPGPDRFDALGRTWRRLVAGAQADPPGSAPGSGLVAVGGLAFSAQGCHSRAWDGFDAASLSVPEVVLARQDDRTWLTVSASVAAQDTVEHLLRRIDERLASLRVAALALLDPAPVGTYRVRSTMPPSHYEEAVARAVERIRDGELQKIVLAREVEVSAPTPYDSGAIFGVLRDAFPSCFVFAVGRGDADFVAASPELLVRREGARVSTVALAGSARRSADPAVDDHLGEQLLRSHKNRQENEIVARRIGRTLAPHSVWVAAAPEPALVRVANIQHLGAPIRAQLRSPIGAVELAGLLHPTPAVGGEPGAVAATMIPALEGLDRGWYAGPVGWMDASGDGEFCVALRCALLRGRAARLYAGAGIVRDSDPAEELAETEVKLEALLPLLAG